MDSGLVVLSFVMMGLFILGAMATQTSTIFSSFAVSDWGVIGFLVKHFNLVLFIGLTLAVFIGLGAFRN